MSIKAKQVAGVTTLVVGIVAILTAYHLATLAKLHLQETVLRGEMLSRAVFQRAREIVPPPGVDLHTALREDGGLRAILESGIGYGPNVTYVAIVDAKGMAIAHAFRSQEGQSMPVQQKMADLLEAGPFRQLAAVYSDQTFEYELPILSGDEHFGSIRIGVSTVLVRDELSNALQAGAGSVLAALLISTLVAMLLAQWMLRPIHVIQSGLTRLGRGELDVSLDLPGEEFRDLGSSFNAVSAQLSAVRSKSPGNASTDLESVMENLEDAVALFSPSGEVIFTNTAMKGLLAEYRDHPAIKQLLDQTLAGRRDAGPVSIRSGSEVEEGHESDDGPERLLMAHAIEDSSGRFIGAMLVARNIGYLSHVHSTLNYSNKLAALGRLMAGVAHEVKNPLNAMTIHLELLKQKLSRAAVAVAAGPAPIGDGPDAVVRSNSTDVSKHVHVIANEIRRLDEVIGGFLKFARPDELKLQPVRLADLISDVVTTVGPEAERSSVQVKVDCPQVSPEINADPGMLRQALLNLAINACQAMPEGGTLRLSCRTTLRRNVEIDVEDTGVGIPPEDLGRVFDLYFTTKAKGTGIGLSMVYRIVQLHDGEVEVQSTPGSGTRFRLIFPQA